MAVFWVIRSEHPKRIVLNKSDPNLFFSSDPTDFYPSIMRLPSEYDSEYSEENQEIDEFLSGDEETFNQAIETPTP